MIVPFCAVCLVKIERRRCWRYSEADIILYRLRSPESAIEFVDHGGAPKFYCARCSFAARETIINNDYGSLMSQLVTMERMAAEARREPRLLTAGTTP